MEKNKYYLGFGYTDSMIQTFYILQNSYNSSKLKRINGFDHKKAFWYQSKIILFLYESISTELITLIHH